jgi:hypothetical protein
MTTSNILRDTTPSPPSAMSQHTSGKGDVLQLQMSDSSDDDIPLLSFKLSALTNALLHSENRQQEAYPRRYQGRQNQPSTTRTSDDNVERQPKSDSSRLYRQNQSSSATGCSLPESDNTRPMRIVRIRSKIPRWCLQRRTMWGTLSTRSLYLNLRIVTNATAKITIRT